MLGDLYRWARKDEVGPVVLVLVTLEVIAWLALR